MAFGTRQHKSLAVVPEGAWWPLSSESFHLFPENWREPQEHHRHHGIFGETRRQKTYSLWKLCKESWVESPRGEVWGEWRGSQKSPANNHSQKQSWTREEWAMSGAGTKWAQVLGEAERGTEGPCLAWGGLTWLVSATARKTQCLKVGTWLCPLMSTARSHQGYW